MKRVLMIAYHFPPFAGSSGVQRALRFSAYLPDFGWEPIVLTAHTRAYEQTSQDLVGDIREGTRVIRAQAWDTKRHLSIGGRYPGFLARPDRWRWWSLGAVPAGLAAIRRYAPQAIWSTYPIATAHRIGVTLAKRSGLPFLADFRDPMAQDDYPEDPLTWKSFARIEKETVRTAVCSTFTTPGAVRLYAARYPQWQDRFQLLENGYDEQSFAAISPEFAPLNEGRLTLLHSGVIYPSERDPTQLFASLARLKSSHPDLYGRLVLRFRSPSHDDILLALARRYDVQASVEILPATGHREALREMCRADGLLLLQADNCSEQIPAKYYEYLRARRPILLLSDPRGDTGLAAARAGLKGIAPLADAEAITGLLRDFAENPALEGLLPDPAAVSASSRYARSRELAMLLDTYTVSARQGNLS